MVMNQSDRQLLGPWCGAAVLAAVMLGVAGCGGSTTAATVHTSPSPTRVGYLTVDGLQRSYVVFRPPALHPDQLAPLLIALHAYTVDTTWMETNTHFDDLANSDGFVVVYPQGTNDSWNAGRCCGHNQNDDVAFIKALIDRLVTSGHIDPHRVYATGMSNGAAMAQRLACDLSDHIAAVASVSGSLVTDSCNPPRAISVLEMHGLEDDIVPYKGGVVAGLTSFPPTMANMQQWAARNGCAARPAVTQDGITMTFTWSACRDGSRIVLDAIAGAGHSWFGPAEMPGEPDATQVAWDFVSHAPPLP
jgi:polyhydroxybutyrate depolymerase